MKSIASSVVLVAALSLSTAEAQDASRWNGFYAGLAASTNTGDMIYNDGGMYDLDGDVVGLIAGYNLASGPWVYGAEMAYSSGRIEEVGNTNFGFESSVDVKGRAGYALSNFLVYGTLGVTFTQWDEGGSGPFDGDGFLYGLGVDYSVSTKFFVGAEYTVRDVTSDWNNSGDTLDADLATFSLRAGMSF